MAYPTDNDDSLTHIDGDLEEVPLGNGGEAECPYGSEHLPLRLHRREGKQGAKPVLLLHGASAGSDTFLTPRPNWGGPKNLVDYLVCEGFEPWLLDWRGSKFVAENSRDRLGDNGTERFNFDLAAERDIVRAVEAIATHNGNPDQKIDAIGFCMGGGILAQALLKDLKGLRGRISKVVLLALGLFYDMNLHGRLKAESRLLQRVISDDPDRLFLDPRTEPTSGELKETWPDSVEDLYKLWRKPYDEDRIGVSGVDSKDEYVLEMFNRVSFMLGEPYLEADLIPEIHETTVRIEVDLIPEILEILSKVGKARDPEHSKSGPFPVGAQVCATNDEMARENKVVQCHGQLAYPLNKKGPMVIRRRTGEFKPAQMLLVDGQKVGKVLSVEDERKPLLPELFGPMALGFLLHGAENLRAGQATTFDINPGAVPAPHLSQTVGYSKNPPYDGFDRLNRLTLITGSLNRLWHRESIDRMAAWLARNPRYDRRRNEKYILRNFGHQDLLWGRHSESVVFPLIKKGLAKKGEPSESV